MNKKVHLTKPKIEQLRSSTALLMINANESKRLSVNLHNRGTSAMVILREIFLQSKSKLENMIVKESQLTAKMKRSLKFKKLLMLTLIKKVLSIIKMKALTSYLISALGAKKVTT